MVATILQPRQKLPEGHCRNIRRFSEYQVIAGIFGDFQNIGCAATILDFNTAAKKSAVVSPQTSQGSAISAARASHSAWLGKSHSLISMRVSPPAVMMIEN
ncbi:MAG: hypothetical protein QGF67_20825, partial [Lentisphaeria bacterium]|nr:hypothetical protein [Lentisphaeria bacterium]